MDVTEFLESIGIDANEVVMYHFTNNEEGETIYIEEILEKYKVSILSSEKAKAETSSSGLNIPFVTNRFKITAVRHDDMDAFGAYASSSIESEEGGLVLLNVEGTIGTCMEHDIEPKQMIIEMLMHEFGHALEEWYECDFDEDRIERIIESYRRKNGW